MIDYSELIERLENFSPPDRTVDEQRPASQAIFDAAAALRELIAFRAKVVESGVYFPVMD